LTFLSDTILFYIIILEPLRAVVLKKSKIIRSRTSFYTQSIKSSVSVASVSTVASVASVSSVSSVASVASVAYQYYQYISIS